MNYIESSKSYTGTELETVFFRPMLNGDSAVDLGVRMLYNMPVPTTVHLWDGESDILRSHTSTGWDATTKHAMSQSTIDLQRVKAEMGFSASDYYSLVFESLATQAEINLDDLSGTDLEAAETELFRRSIAESIRATMWVGDESRTTGVFDTFTGFVKRVFASERVDGVTSIGYTDTELKDVDYIITIFDLMWKSAPERLKDMKGDGQLAFFVTSDLYTLYEKYLDSAGVDASYTDIINGRQGLMYHGIPVIDMRIGSYLSQTTLSTSFGFLTDRRNLVLAVNTADFPGTEIRMWYNPDEMENRQRAIFAAGTTILDDLMLSLTYKIYVS